MSLSKKVTLFLMALVIGLVIGLLVAIRLDIYPTATAKKETGEIWQTVSTVGIEDAIINVAKTIGKATVSISTFSKLFLNLSDCQIQSLLFISKFFLLFHFLPSF